MHKFVLQYFAIPFVFLLLPAVSYSQHNYQVEISAVLINDKYNTVKLEGTLVTAEIFLDEVTTGSHPYAEAAFLEKASSLAVGYFDADYNSTNFDFSEDGMLLGVNYTEPNSLFIFQVVYLISDTDYKNGLNGNLEADSTYIGVGKYISENSALMGKYS